jgi:two-component system response regulator RegX3
MTNILIVEDHSIVREPLARLLRLEGYRALCAADGNEALAALRSEHVDLVLLDLMMPHKGGVAFLEALRERERWRDLPVLVLTGVTEGSALQRVRELHPTDVLTKSRFTVDELFARIRRIVGPEVQSAAQVKNAECRVQNEELAPEGR